MVLGTRKGVQGIEAGVIDESTAYRSTLPNLIVRLTLTSISLKTAPRARPRSRRLSFSSSSTGAFPFSLAFCRDTPPPGYSFFLPVDL